MKKLLLIVPVMAVLSFSARAQLLPANEAGVSLGAWHTIVRDIDTTTKWWELWGGKPIKIDGIDVMKFHGVFIFMVKGEPNAGSKGHFIDHIAFQTPRGFELLKKLTDAGVKTDPIDLRTMRSPRWKPESDQRTWNYTYNPDGLYVEVETDEDAVAADKFDTPMTSDMMHMYFKDLDAMRVSYRFYKTYFGGETHPDANINIHIPGTKINYATANGKPRPANRGGALDFIGFEVKDLPAFVKKLEAAGVKFDEPYSKTRHKSYASAMFTGPGGEAVELTEGLRKF
jgi:Glyoxalase/Bleomycin resistance protein/Dioxygenase superfamily